MGKTIGIDLGTTNSCVCVLDGDDRTVIPNAEGARTTPSIVAFTEDGERLVGQLAKRQAHTNAVNTIYAVKRLIGKRYDSEDVQEAMRSVSYEIVEADNGDAWVSARGKQYSAPEISSFILREMKNVAEDFIGEEVEDAVVTVPAYFNDAQRQATKNAGKIAGLNVLRIVNEPTAAALAYGVGQGGTPEDQTVAVYDMGGGTFDISILELTEGVFSVVSTSGDTFLGGEDFDNVVIDWLAEQFEAEHGIDLRGDKIALQRLKEEAERAKCELSTKEDTDISMPFIYSDDDGPKHLETTLSREQLEELVADLVEESMGPCKQALSDASLTKSDIDTVLLVGGMTRMPLIRRKVEEFFGKTPDASVNPDEVVALGAAVQGSIARGELTDVLLLDVTPLTLGLETAGGVFTPLIPRNTTIPCSHSETFSTARDNQSMVRVHVLQGERQMADANKSLAKFELVGIPPAPRGVPKIQVTFSIDENGMVNVRAKDEGSGKEQSVNIVADGGLSEAQINKMIAQAAEYEQQDRLQKELVEMRNEAQGLLYSTERSFNEFGNALLEEEQTDIANDIATIKDLVEDANKEELEAIIANLEASAYRLAEAMYASEAEDEA
ncbi:MAG: molecular chaperone DnaK [Persicimonas sp.]